MKKIVLCGMMGSGKTTVAGALSRIYGLRCVDTDELITRKFGPINDIFATRGEEYFRDVESLVAAQAARSPDNDVIALGGGCVLRAANVRALRQSGVIFYLRAAAQTVIERVRGDSSRPLLKGDLEERVNSILAARSAVYESVADVVIDTDDKSPEEIAKIITEHMQS